CTACASPARPSRARLPGRPSRSPERERRPRRATCRPRGHLRRRESRATRASRRSWLTLAEGGLTNRYGWTTDRSRRGQHLVQHGLHLGDLVAVHEVAHSRVQLAPDARTEPREQALALEHSFLGD